MELPSRSSRSFVGARIVPCPRGSSLRARRGLDYAVSQHFGYSRRDAGRARDCMQRFCVCAHSTLRPEGPGCLPSSGPVTSGGSRGRGPWTCTRSSGVRTAAARSCGRAQDEVWGAGQVRCRQFEDQCSNYARNAHSVIVCVA